MVLGIIDSICRNTPATLVYVTHNPDELLDCITYRLELGSKKKD
jgi:ABC-type molybdenum transport system ATPase subunit/photorepair protein PhrA